MSKLTHIVKYLANFSYFIIKKIINVEFSQSQIKCHQIKTHKDEL